MARKPKLNTTPTQEIVSLEEGNLPPIEGAYLVLAGPGSGKTTLLVSRLVQILSASSLGRTRVLALTFTNKAAAEMKARLSEQFRDLDERCFIGTFHSFANRVLRAHGNLISIPNNFVILDQEDQKEVLRELQQSGKIPEGTDTDSVIFAFSRLKSRGALRRDGSLEPPISESLVELHQAYSERLESLNALDFGDLILEAIRLFQARRQILDFYRTAHRFILVDEFQDTTPAQYELLKLLLPSDRANIFAVADEDQLIYEWNEARQETLEQLCRDFPTTVIYSTLSYRCPPHVVEAANAVISNNRLRFQAKPEIKSRPGLQTDHIFLHEAKNEEDEGRFVGEKIKELIASNRSLQYRDIGIIARTRRILDAPEQQLRQIGVPAARPSLGGIGGSEEGQIILRLLRWLQNPRDEQGARRVLSFLCPEGICLVQEAVQEAHARSAPFESILFDNLSKSKNSQILRNLLENVPKWRLHLQDARTLLSLVREEFSHVFAKKDDKERHAADLLACIDELANAAKQIGTGRKVSVPDFLLALPQLVTVRGADPAAIQKGVVSLLTVHQAKGLEFKMVFLTGLEDGTFPDFRSERDGRRLEEERRLFYVGITRTKERLFLSFSIRRRDSYGRIWPREPSRFIEEIPAHLLKQV